jgi:hypothetical protein
MAQITWRNINNPSFTGGNDQGEIGGDLIMDGLNSLAGLVGNQEQLQKKELTDEALGQINQLDRPGLENAIQGRDFQDRGNVDQSAINKALKGRGKGIDSENDAKFSRDEMLSNRADQPILGAIELAMQNNEWGKVNELRTGLSSDAARAKAGKAAELGQRNDAKVEREDKVLTDKIANEDDADYTSDTILGSEDQILNAVATGGNVDGLIQSILGKAQEDRSGTWDASENSALKKSLQGISNPTFTASTNDRLNDELTLDYEKLDQQQVTDTEAHDRLATIVNGGKVDVNSDEQLESMANFMSELDENYGSESILPNFSWKDDGDTAGVALKQDLESLRQEGNYSVPMLRAAMKIHSQSDAGAFGDPDVYLTTIKETLKQWDASKDGGKTMQAALELVPVPTSGDARDISDYKFNLDKMVKSFQGKTGKAKMNRLLKESELKLKKSGNSINSRKNALKSQKYAEFRQKLLNK